MSPRAACRLETLGFQDVYDYVPGKADWLAHGLPVEGVGVSRLTARSLIRRDVSTCLLGETVADVLPRVEASSYAFGLVLNDSQVLLGRLRLAALRAAAGGDSMDVCMEPGPSTVRPDTPVETMEQRMRQHDLHAAIVSDPEGRLMGVVRRDDVNAMNVTKSSQEGSESTCE